MKYIFGFNVGCKVYKKFPELTIAVNSRLIDELVLDEDHLYNPTAVLDRKSSRYPDGEFGDRRWAEDNLCSRKINLYTLDDKDLSEKITIKIENSDSNYTNGFMTRSTLITFNFVFLLPEFMLFENRKKVLGQITQGKKYQINDVNQKNKLVYAWPLDNTHSFQWYGDSRVLEFPIVQDGIEFKRFNPKCMPEDYMDPKELGIKTNMENNVCLNVRKRFIEIIDRVL